MSEYRLVQKSHWEVFEEEEPGGASDIVGRSGDSILLWEGQCNEQPSSQFFHDLGMKLPADEYEEDTGEPDQHEVGETEYTYTLSEHVDGKWKKCTDIKRDREHLLFKSDKSTS